jgi:DNA-binding protein HU
MAKNRTELVAEVAEKSGKSQATVNAVLDAVFQVFESSVSKGEKITIPGWMAIERTDRAARTGRNPQTGETIQIPAGHGVKLTAGSKLKAAVATKKKATKATSKKKK